MNKRSLNHYNDKFKGIAFVEIKYRFHELISVYFYHMIHRYFMNSITGTKISKVL